MGSCEILPCIKTSHPLGRRFPYRRKTVMSIQKVNTRSTFKLSEVKVAGKTQPEKRKRVPVVGVAGAPSRSRCGSREVLQGRRKANVLRGLGIV